MRFNSKDLKSMCIDKRIHKEFSEYCKKEGYVIGRICEKLIKKWLEKQKEDSLKDRGKNNG